MEIKIQYDIFVKKRGNGLKGASINLPCPISKDFHDYYQKNLQAIHHSLNLAPYKMIKVNGLD